MLGQKREGERRAASGWVGFPEESVTIGRAKGIYNEIISTTYADAMRQEMIAVFMVMIVWMKRYRYCRRESCRC